ncbi:Response regulator receiver domain-containing protein [Rhodoblastus acidophilus]|uniref:Response regulator receiver domain-containing protein n=1 Tax=Rhodoblastus acidophilus TaxID=1074 RepID=A0A212RQ25_RHOAC|nr:response regulator [Rhodoblastus acidophilus]PPQ38506.1 response regulator [Rhodoblastus acidophilus]RAI21819.1 response regulator [Rhodoblastus acidophilus]SNB74553.1 Response regulator receiver domain-containing protein [Rhodoblastus acidophilus]
MPDRNRAVSIVMVEDDEGHARLIEKNIRRAGVSNEIVVFATGAAALDYLFDARRGSRAPCLILLDLNLPDMTGVEILTALKLNEATRLSPVIVLTTTDDKREIEKCYERGANVYITKPLNYDNFANAIRQLGLFLSVIQVPDLD